MALSRYLDFEPTDEPHWRKDNANYNERIPKILDMLNDILIYRRTWKEMNETKSATDVQRVKREMFIDFLLKLQINENIGIADKGTFEKLVDEEQETMNITRGVKRAIIEDEDEKSNNKTKRHNAGDNKACEEINKEGQESLPSSLELVETIEETSDQIKVTEARNLLRGYWHLKKEVDLFNSENIEGYDYLGELDVDVCIKECHKILMEDVIDKKKTPPGKFSTKKRVVEYKGKTFFYPSYETEEIAHAAVDIVVKEYNLMVKEISKIEDEKKKIALSMKCAAVLLFALLTLHPFADGNGRLSRLLCNHCLRQLCPFPTAIYNWFSATTRDDYIEALINARKSLALKPDKHKSTDEVIFEALRIMEQKPADLCALVIESNWFSWRQFLQNLGEDIHRLECESNFVQEVSSQP